MACYVYWYEQQVLHSEVYPSYGDADPQAFYVVDRGHTSRAFMYDSDDGEWMLYYDTKRSHTRCLRRDVTEAEVPKPIRLLKLLES